MIRARWCVAILAGWLLAGCASGWAPGAPRGNTVTGTGRVASRPDTAVVEIGVEARAPRLAEATAEVDRTLRAVLTAVKARGVRDADVRTTSYAIDPVAEPRRPGDRGTSLRIVGYRVFNVVQVRTRDVDEVGGIVDAAVAAGANVVRGIHFTLEDPSSAEAEARTLAVQDAAAKAGRIAAAAGLRLGRLLAVRDASPARPMPRMALAATGPGPVEPGQLEVTVSLEARYAIER
jgi:uncharacterized protein YggE